MDEFDCSRSRESVDRNSIVSPKKRKRWIDFAGELFSLALALRRTYLLLVLRRLYGGSLYSLDRDWRRNVMSSRYLGGRSRRR